MTDIRKFVTDLEKIKKIFRQNNNGQWDYNKLQKDIRNLFERSTSCPTGLPASIFEYWENQYIYKSADLGEEPTADNINKLAAFLAFNNMKQNNNKNFPHVKNIWNRKLGGFKW